jgi:hypothetical protein
MRKVLFTAVILLALGGNAYAFPWSLQVRGYGSASFPLADEWSQLYERAALGGGGLSVDATLIGGFGLYLAYGYEEASHTIENQIKARLGADDVALGLQFHLPLTEWFVPGVHVAPTLSVYHEVISDEFFKYNMDFTGYGYEAGVDLNFYPFYWAGWSHGLGFFVDLLYRGRPLDNMGKLTDASGLGFRAGIEYRWDFGETVARPTIEPPPPPPVEQRPPAPEPPPPPRP